MSSNLFILFGLIIGVLVCLVVLRAINKNHSLRTEYDEMQKKARGEAYMYGFWAMLIYEVLLAVTEQFIRIPAEPFVLHFLAIMTGVVVQASYSIMHDAYVGLNTRKNTFLITMVLIAALNLFVVISAFAENRMVVNGIVQFPFCNLVICISFALLAVVSLIRKNMQKEEAE